MAFDNLISLINKTGPIDESLAWERQKGRDIIEPLAAKRSKAQAEAIK